jgi:hypothetical protein
MYGLLSKALSPTNQMIKNLIVIEDAYINTSHPDFMGGAAAMINVFDPANYTQKKKPMGPGDFKDKAFNYEGLKEAADGIAD